MKSTIYTREGAEKGEVTLPESVFGISWNADLVHSVVVGMQANAREGTAHTKVRSEKRGGGRKPWRQKGTGRARHGSRRSPIWTGGGVTFGPRSEKDYSVKINKKVRAKAFATVMSKKLADNEVIFVETLAMDEPKTKDALAVIKALAKGSGNDSLATKRKNAALVVLSDRNLATEKSFRNFGNVEVAQAKDINPVDLLTYKYVVVADPAAAVEIFAARVGATAPKSN
jgi:large subunit ribosomal protein L4